LEKREENAIRLGSTSPNAQVVDKANGSSTPISPNPLKTYVISCLIGLFVPFSIMFIWFSYDNKVRTIEDLEKFLNAPILGDIPKTKSKSKIIIDNNTNDSISEAFRLLRTNLSFMFSKNVEASKTIMISSTLASEGKTFISINLAKALALSNKSVLVIGADLRKPKLKKYLESSIEIGLANYLANSNIQIPQIINQDETIGFDYINAGDTPPNPSELLMNDRFQELLAYGKTNYDYLIIDTPPVSLVTDTLLISRHADLFIYIVRANFLDKRLLKTAKNMYDKNRLPNMALLLNQSNFVKKSYGYAYGYGKK
jgi:capsular exopolysaccharide synthesis family protein